MIGLPGHRALCEGNPAKDNLVILDVDKNIGKIFLPKSNILMTAPNYKNGFAGNGKLPVSGYQQVQSVEREPAELRKRRKQ